MMELQVGDRVTVSKGWNAGDRKGEIGVVEDISQVDRTDFLARVRFDNGDIGRYSITQLKKVDEAGGSLKVQVGGSHYKDFPVQPVEFIHRNNMGFIQGNVVKYVCRYKAKNGIEDLKKAQHYLQMLIEMEEQK